MEPPNAALMARYGTEAFHRKCLEKRANRTAVTAAKVMAPFATMALLNADSVHRERLEQEAAMLNILMRQLEAERQAALQQGLQGGEAMTPQGRAIQELMPLQARYRMLGLMKQGSADSAEAMDKEAIVGAFGALAKGLGKGLSATGRRMASPGGVVAGGQPFARMGQRMRQSGVGLQQTGQQWSRHGMGAQGRFSQAAAKANMGPTFTRPGAAQSAQARVAAKGAPRAVAPTAAARAPQRKPMRLLSPMTKLKMGLGAAGLGTAYAGYKGLQTARDYMMIPSSYQGQRWGSGVQGPALSQYGYAY